MILIITYYRVIGFVLPKAILSYFSYFTTDAGPEAFELSIPMW